MKIYIDFDDVISETGKAFLKIAKEQFQVNLPYQEFQFFNMKKAFGIDEEQYEKLMDIGHTKEYLLSYEETPGASDTINRWYDQGHDIYVITGRPVASYEASRLWLDNHNLNRIPLFCVDKYGREAKEQPFTYNMTLSKLYSMDFDFAIEDSPLAFEHVMKFPNCGVAIFNRPWNQNSTLPNEKFHRCYTWDEVDAYLSTWMKKQTK